MKNSVLITSSESSLKYKNRGKMSDLKPNQWAMIALEKLFSVKGGLVDCHRHLDRQNSLDHEGYQLIANDATLEEKQDYIDRVKRKPSYLSTLRERIEHGVFDMMMQNICASRTFIDADSTIGLSALDAALAVKKLYNHKFYLQIAASPVKGVYFEEDRRIFERGCEMSDVVGVILSRGKKRPEQYLIDYATLMYNGEYFFDLAMMFKKPIDLQMDQANDRREQESRILVQLAKKYRELGYTQSITATHCISLGAQSKEFIRKTARDFKELGIYVNVCSGAALSMKQDGKAQGPVRNSIAPVKEFLEEGTIVALGTDNVSDIFMPFTNGEFREEIRELARAIRWQDDLSKLADMATINGRLVLGLPLPHEKEAAYQ